jgi:PASTA domain
MARPFDITTTGDTATIAPGGNMRLVFTVTNTTQRPVRGSLRIKALDSGQASWLTIGGDAERDFSPGQAHQVEVTAKVPAGTAAGKFRVRLDALSVANPDDDFTEGPSVSLTITPPPPPPNGGIPWWVWLIIGVVVLAVIGVAAWLLMRNKSGPSGEVIPEGLVGKPFADAKKELEALGLVVTAEKNNVFNDCPDKVLKTTPAAGAPAASGAAVTVTITALAYGPATCKQGFVWREAFQGDAVCVTPETRAQAQADNAAQGERTELVPATSKDFDDLQKEHPQASAVAKGDFNALAAVIPRERLVLDPNRIALVRRCKVGYTERRASATDRVCVTQATQIATDADNRAAESRKACSRP